MTELNFDQQPINSDDTLFRLTTECLAYAFDAIERANDAEAAKAAVTHALNIGYHVVKRGDLVRSIEARLPPPTKNQIDGCCMLLERSTDTIHFARPIGAFHDRVLVIMSDDNPNKLRLKVLIITNLPDVEINHATWDKTYPKKRRHVPVLV